MPLHRLPKQMYRITIRKAACGYLQLEHYCLFWKNFIMSLVDDNHPDKKIAWQHKNKMSLNEWRYVLVHKTRRLGKTHLIAWTHEWSNCCRSSVEDTDIVLVHYFPATTCIWIIGHLDINNETVRKSTWTRGTRQKVTSHKGYYQKHGHLCRS